MHDIADDRHSKSRDPAFVFANSERIEQRLSRVLVSAVASVDDRGVYHPRELMRHARRRVSNHYRVGRHRLEVSRGVDQRFTFRDR